MIELISLYLKAHERLLIAILAAVLIFSVVNKIDNRVAAHDNVTLQAAKTADAAVAVQVQKDEAVVAQKDAQLQAATARVDAANAALVQANATLAAALVKQQKTDATLNDPALAQRWNTLVPDAVSISNDKIEITDSGAHATVAQLEQVPVLATQLANETTQNTNLNALLLSASGDVQALKVEVGDLQIKSTKDAQVCTDQIKVERDNAEKKEKRGFKIGFVLGFLARQALTIIK